MGSSKPPGNWRSKWLTQRRGQFNTSALQVGDGVPAPWLTEELKQYRNVTPDTLSEARRRWHQNFYPEGMEDTGLRLLRDTVWDYTKNGSSTMTATPRVHTKVYLRVLHGENTFQFITTNIYEWLSPAIVNTYVNLTVWSPTIVVSGDASLRHDIAVIPAYGSYDGDATGFTQSPTVIGIFAGPTFFQASAQQPGFEFAPLGTVYASQNSEVLAYPDAATKTRVQNLATALLGEEEL